MLPEVLSAFNVKVRPLGMRFEDTLATSSSNCTSRSSFCPAKPFNAGRVAFGAVKSSVTDLSCASVLTVFVFAGLRFGSAASMAYAFSSAWSLGISKVMISFFNTPLTSCPSTLTRIPSASVKKYSVLSGTTLIHCPSTFSLYGVAVIIALPSLWGSCFRFFGGREASAFTSITASEEDAIPLWATAAT